MKKRPNKTLVFLAAATLLCACSINGRHGNGDDNFFSAFKTFPDAEWNYAEPAVFHVDTLRDSISEPGILTLTVRHTNGYPYCNLWLELARLQGDSITAKDTLNITMADAFGKWRGHGSGPTLQLTDTIATGMRLHIHDTLRLRHIMRTDTLQGIEQIGISFF
ncbi:MAG: gliding motility lipoprotein GldH [Muribaculaceae bacterium]|nr:gliding motility lipoprotein GldH [Muribaculaceae bacterium]